MVGEWFVGGCVGGRGGGSSHGCLRRCERLGGAVQFFVRG